MLKRCNHNENYVIKKLILIISLSAMLSANLDTKIRDLLGEADYNTHKNLINHNVQTS